MRPGGASERRASSASVVAGARNTDGVSGRIRRKVRRREPPRIVAEQMAAERDDVGARLRLRRFTCQRREDDRTLLDAAALVGGPDHGQRALVEAAAALAGLVAAFAGGARVPAQLERVRPAAAWPCFSASFRFC